MESTFFFHRVGHFFHLKLKYLLKVVKKIDALTSTCKSVLNKINLRDILTIFTALKSLSYIWSILQHVCVHNMQIILVI